MREYDLDSTGSRYVRVAGSFESGNTPPGFYTTCGISYLAKQPLDTQ
jgi:hypothetical protein